MTKKFILKAILLLLLIGFTLGAVAPIRCPKGQEESWMAQLEDSRSLATLSIPGTHDSGALYSIGGVFGKCQTLHIRQQLDIGVRFFDLRLRLVDDRLDIYHNFVEQRASFETLLQTLVSYVRQHPSECLLVSLKEEDDPVRSEKDFTQALEAMLLAYPDVISTADTLPDTLGQARGKIFILARYEDNTLGIPCSQDWVNNSAFQLGRLYIQDHYKLEHFQEKLPDIREGFAAAASGEYALVLNYTSCYLSSGFPPSYAGTPAQDINPWLEQALREDTGPAGVVICDFITSDLAAAIIGRNFS